MVFKLDVHFRNDEKQRKRTQSMPSNSASQKLRSKPINKFLEDNESYYKIEILSGKLRSSSSTSTPYMLTSNKRSHETSPNKPRTSRTPKNSPKKPQISKKTRTKEITVLNREAVHFLFPSSPEDDDDDESDTVEDSDGSNSGHDLKKTTPKTSRKVSKKVCF